MRFRNRQTKFCMLLIGELPPTQIRCHLCKRYFYVSHLDSAELCCFSKFCSCAKWDLFNKFYCPECIKVKFTVELEQHFVSNQLWDRRHLIPGSICGQKLLTKLVSFTKRNWKSSNDKIHYSTQFGFQIGHTDVGDRCCALSPKSYILR